MIIINKCTWCAAILGLALVSNAEAGVYQELPDLDIPFVSSEIIELNGIDESGYCRFILKDVVTVSDEVNDEYDKVYAYRELDLDDCRAKVEVGMIPASAAANSAVASIPASTVLPLPPAVSITGPAGSTVGNEGITLVDLAEALGLSERALNVEDSVAAATDTKNLCGYQVDAVSNKATYGHKLPSGDTGPLRKVVSGLDIKNSHFEWNSFCWNGGYYEPLSESTSSTDADHEFEPALLWLPVDPDGDINFEEVPASGSATLCSGEFSSGGYNIMGLGGAFTIHAQIQEIPAVYNCPSTGKPMVLGWIGGSIVYKDDTYGDPRPKIVNFMGHDFLKTNRSCLAGNSIWLPPKTYISSSCF